MKWLLVVICLVGLVVCWLVAKYDQAERESRNTSCACHPAYHALGVHEPGRGGQS